MDYGVGIVCRQMPGAYDVEEAYKIWRLQSILNAGYAINP